jgi:di/tricarboxylate transporter
MTSQLTIVLGLLASAIAMFALNKPRMDAVALIMLTALPFTGAVTMNEALAGFSDPNIVLIAALFVIGDGLVRTGVARRMGDWLAKTAGGSEAKLLVLLMVVVCGLGATMSSTAVTAIFIPVVLRVSQSVGASPRRLMMPLSMAALISGMTTLIATAPNLVVNSELLRSGHTGFNFFSFAPFGAPILVLAVLYMLVARKWLSGEAGRPSQNDRPRLRDWIKSYQLADRERRVRITADSPLVNQTLAELAKQNAIGATIIAIERNGKLIAPNLNTQLQVGDAVFVDLASSQAGAEVYGQLGIEELPISGEYFTDLSQEIGMAEVIVPASSEHVGRTPQDINFRARYGLTTVGLRRSAHAEVGNLWNQQLEVGDTLLVCGPWDAIRNLQSAGSDLVVFNLPAELAEVLPVAGKAWQAVGCLALAIGLMISGVIPNVQAALIGCLAMGVLGCVNLTSSYRSIDWKTIVLIVGMLPFAVALERTGGVELAADGLMALVGDSGTTVVLATLFAITAGLGMFISNTATAVLMAPVAISMAEDLGASPLPFAMIVALAASTAFMTPVSSPVNTLVVTPGDYTFGDFVKIGVPFSLIVMIVSVILVPLLMPL